MPQNKRIFWGVLDFLLRQIKIRKLLSTHLCHGDETRGLLVGGGGLTSGRLEADHGAGRRSPRVHLGLYQGLVDAAAGTAGRRLPHRGELGPGHHVQDGRRGTGRSIGVGLQQAGRNPDPAPPLGAVRKVAFHRASVGSTSRMSEHRLRKIFAPPISRIFSQEIFCEVLYTAFRGFFQSHPFQQS
jgi:hypothetical protein